MKKEASTQVFYYEYCEIFKSSYFEEHPRTAACNKCLIKTRKLDGRDKIQKFDLTNFSLKPF